MGFLLREERENLLIEYKHLNEEVWERSFHTRVVNAILTIGSLLVAFVPMVEGFPTPIASILLIATAVVLSITSDKVVNTLRNRMRQIAKQLRIHEPQDTYEVEVGGKWWYIIRRNVVYALYATLLGIYFFLLSRSYYDLGAAIAVGLMLIGIREMIPNIAKDRQANEGEKKSTRQ